jgi:hypothetical protein
MQTNGHAEMKKFSFIIVVSLFSNLLYSQENKPIILDIDNILEDLKNEGQSSKYLKGLNPEAMLLLDFSCLKDLLKVNPRMLSEKGINPEDFSAPTDSNNIKQYQLLFSSDLRTLFTEHETFRLLIQKTWGDNIDPDYKLESEVYIKEPDKAIFTIYGRSWSKTFRLTMNNGLIILENTSQIIED